MDELKKNRENETLLLKGDLLEANQRNFEKYSIAFEKNHKKWLAEQTSLNREITEVLKAHRRVAYWGGGFYIAVLFIFILGTLYSAAWEWFMSLHWGWWVGAIFTPLVLWLAYMEYQNRKNRY